MTQLKMLSADDKLAEIRRLYFTTTRQTIHDDLAKALDLLRAMETEAQRERATVYMEGLSQMRSDWSRQNKSGSGKTGSPKPASGKKRRG